LQQNITDEISLCQNFNKAVWSRYSFLNSTKKMKIYITYCK